MFLYQRKRHAYKEKMNASQTKTHASKKRMYFRPYKSIKVRINIKQ